MCMWGPLPQAPVPAGHLRPGAPARRPGAAFPERVQDRAVEGAREEPGQGCALCQGAAAFPAQPGGLGGPAGSAWGPAWGLPRPFQASSPALLQDTSDCYLELFPSHLYFQAHGSEGLTFQVRGNGQTEEAGKREGGCRPLGGGGRGSGDPALPFPVPWQGLLPLAELSVCRLEGSREHAFQITGVWGMSRLDPAGPESKAYSVTVVSAEPRDSGWT